MPDAALPDVLIGTVYHILNRRMSIDWKGALDTFMRQRAPHGLPLLNDPETVIKMGRLRVPIYAAAAESEVGVTTGPVETFFERYYDNDPRVLDDISGTGTTIHGLLRVAASAGNPGLCEALLARGAAIDAAGFAGMSAVHWAAAWGETETLRFLIGRGARHDAVTEYSWDLLTLASANGAADTCAFLGTLGFTHPLAAFHEMLERWGVTSLN